MHWAKTLGVMIRLLILIFILSFLGLGKGRAKGKDFMEVPKGIIGRYYEDDYPVIMKFVNEFPNGSVTSKFPILTVVSWEYDGSERNGMPPKNVNERMILLEGTLVGIKS